jgi:hypothetical protein
MHRCIIALSRLAGDYLTKSTALNGKTTSSASHRFVSQALRTSHSLGPTHSRLAGPQDLHFEQATALLATLHHHPLHAYVMHCKGHRLIMGLFCNSNEDNHLRGVVRRGVTVFTVKDEP